MRSFPPVVSDTDVPIPKSSIPAPTGRDRRRHAVFVIIECGHVERLMDVTHHVHENPQGLALGQIYRAFARAFPRNTATA